MPDPFSPGEIWWVRDAEFSFPDDLGPPFSGKGRPAIILTGDDTLIDQNFPTVLVAPCSKQPERANQQDLILRPPAVPLPFATRVMMSMIQPLNKAALKDCAGALEPITFQLIQRHILHIFGMERR